jgi:hypothetical protein
MENNEGAMSEQKWKFVAIQSEEELKKYHGKITSVDGKSEFCWGWRACLDWVHKNYALIRDTSGSCLASVPKSEPSSVGEKPDFEQDLMIEAAARHLGSSRGTPIAKQGFISGADWCYKKYVLPARKRIEELEAVYNKLGVKFDKELERWQERDGKERDRIAELEKENGLFSIANKALTKERNDLREHSTNQDSRIYELESQNAQLRTNRDSFAIGFAGYCIREGWRATKDVIEYYKQKNP